jgi:uncharacterized protein YjbI with pentapeptide repeats
MAKKDVREIKASAIIAQLNAGKHIYLTHCIVWGDLDFTTLRNRNRISNNLTQVFVDQSITFDDCIFINQVKAYDATAGVCVEFAHNLSFIGCDFRGEVDFTESIVGGHLFFTGSVFRGIAHFQGAHFRHKKTYFNETQFEDEALFQNAVFAGDASFMHAVFDSSALFQKVVAGGLMFFGNVRFNGYADFTYARAAESIFRYAQFNGRSDFSDSNLTPDMQIDN